MVLASGSACCFRSQHLPARKVLEDSWWTAWLFWCARADDQLRVPALVRRSRVLFSCLFQGEELMETGSNHFLGQGLLRKYRKERPAYCATLKSQRARTDAEVDAQLRALAFASRSKTSLRYAEVENCNDECMGYKEKRQRNHSVILQSGPASRASHSFIFTFTFTCRSLRYRNMMQMDSIKDIPRA